MEKWISARKIRNISETKQDKGLSNSVEWLYKGENGLSFDTKNGDLECPWVRGDV